MGPRPGIRNSPQPGQRAGGGAERKALAAAAVAAPHPPPPAPALSSQQLRGLCPQVPAGPRSQDLLRQAADLCALHSGWQLPPCPCLGEAGVGLLSRGHPGSPDGPHT